MATTTKAKTTPALDYADGGRRLEKYLRKLDEWAQTKDRNPADPAVAYGRRGTLTVERDRAWAELREWITPVLAAEAEADRRRREEEATQ